MNRHKHGVSLGDTTNGTHFVSPESMHGTATSILVFNFTQCILATI